MSNFSTPDLKTIRVYGTLAKLLKRRTFQAVVRSPLDAINFLLSNFPELQTYIEPRAFQIIVNDKPINHHQLATPVDVSADEIQIIPAICGAGGDNNVGLVSILAGAALIGASFLFPLAAPILLPLGIGLVLTGAAALIAPVTPEDEDRSDPSSSYFFNGIQNTSREGVAVPCVYGEIVTGSVTISLGVIEDGQEIEEDFESGTGDPDPEQQPFPETTPFGPEINPPFPSEPQPAPGDEYGAICAYYWVWVDNFGSGTPTCSSGQCWSGTSRGVAKVVQFSWQLNSGDLGPDIVWVKNGPLTFGWTPNTFDCDNLCVSTLGCFTQKDENNYTRSADYFQWLPYRSDGVTAANAGLTQYRYSTGEDPGYTFYNGAGATSCTARTRIPQGITYHVAYGQTPVDALAALPDSSEVTPPVGVPPEGYDER